MQILAHATGLLQTASDAVRFVVSRSPVLPTADE